MNDKKLKQVWHLSTLIAVLAPSAACLFFSSFKMWSIIFPCIWTPLFGAAAISLNKELEKMPIRSNAVVVTIVKKTTHTITLADCDWEEID